MQDAGSQGGGVVGSDVESEADAERACGCPRCLRSFRRRAIEQPDAETEVVACCHLHRVMGCCDPEDCGPCCENCPTCPTINGTPPASPTAR